MAMPRALAASITVAPLCTSICLPSISTFGMSFSGRLPGGDAGSGEIAAGLAHHAALVFDVILEFVAEVLDETFHRHRRRIPEGADGAPGDVVGHVAEQIQVLLPPLAVFDAVDHAVHPAGALAAGRALAAGFFEIEIRQAPEGTPHAGGLR